MSNDTDNRTETKLIPEGRDRAARQVAWLECLKANQPAGGLHDHNIFTFGWQAALAYRDSTPMEREVEVVQKIATALAKIGIVFSFDHKTMEVKVQPEDDSEGWVSVEERPPKSGKLVEVTWGTEESVIVARHYDNPTSEAGKRSQGWAALDGWINPQFPKSWKPPSHWREIVLPAPPAKENK